MKAFLLVAAFLLSVTSSFGQLSPRVTSTLVLDKPFKGANTIIVALPDSGLAAWDKLHIALKQQGFTIKASDKNQPTLVSEPKATTAAGSIAVSAEVQGTKVMLRGTTNTLTNAATPATLEYRGRKDRPTLLTWQQFDAVAKALGGKVEYTRQK